MGSVFNNRRKEDRRELVTLSEFLGDQIMTIVLKRKKRPRKRNFLRDLFFPERVRERQCRVCGRPFLEHPEREPLQRFEEGNVELLLYKDATTLRTQYRIRVGVWRFSLDGYYFAQLFERGEFADLQRVLSEAVEFVKGCEKG